MRTTERKRRNFSEDFKKDAVELGQRVGASKAAKELGVHVSSIRTWTREDSPEGESKKALKKSYGDLEKEIRRLSKENGYLKEINRVLKKSTAIFSADQMVGLK